jgi:uncharacterized protein YqcC (DUF446 family)
LIFCITHSRFLSSSVSRESLRLTIGENWLHWVHIPKMKHCKELNQLFFGVSSAEKQG